MQKSKQKPFSRQTAKFLSTIGENIPELTGEQMQAWIQNPKILQKVLLQLDQPMLPGFRPSPIQEWRTITVGGKTNTQLAEELKHFGVEYDEVMLANCPEILTPHRARLAVVSPSDLGWLGEWPTMQAFLAKFAEAGLSYHAAVGPYLRLAFLDQVEDPNKCLHIAMEPLPWSHPSSLGFWYLDRHKSNLTLVDDASCEGWNRDATEVVAIMGKLEPIEPVAG